MALKTQKKWQLFLFGGVAACCGEVFTLPFDVVKVRMQIEGGVVKSNVTRRGGFLGMFDFIVNIANTEGIPALWKGAKPAFLRNFTYGGMRFGLYEPIKSLLVNEDAKAAIPGDNDGSHGGNYPFHIKLLSGLGSGGIAAAVCNPTDVLKVSMQTDTAGTKYRGLIHGFTTIARTEGMYFEASHPPTN
jgi:solute carrier family 25 uncoupling protein 8/9